MLFSTEVGARCVNYDQAYVNCDQVNSQCLPFTTVCNSLSQDYALSILTHELHLSCSSTMLQEKAIVKQSRRYQRACSISQCTAYYGSLQEKGSPQRSFQIHGSPIRAQATDSRSARRHGESEGHRNQIHQGEGGAESRAGEEAVEGCLGHSHGVQATQRRTAVTDDEALLHNRSPRRHGVHRSS
jgi:hypothetical protein